MNGHNGPRALNVSPMVRNLLVANVLVFLPSLVLPEPDVYELLLRFGLVPQLFGDWLAGRGALPWSSWTAWLTHMFLHAGFAHLAINMLVLLAFGTPVEQRLGPGRFLGLYFASGLVAAVTHVLLNLDSPYPMIGASGAISGLLGGAVLFAFDHRSPVLRQQVRLHLGSRGRIFAVSWVVINIVFGIIGLGGLAEGGVIAWEAHLGGFFAGLLLMPLFDRGRETAWR
jgi:membrane associated rhomboid family serine protease